jgi:hypothetical protein
VFFFSFFFYLFITETPPLGCDRGGDPPHYFATAEVGPVEVYIPFMRCMGTLLMDRIARVEAQGPLIWARHVWFVSWSRRSVGGVSPPRFTSLLHLVCVDGPRRSGFIAWSLEDWSQGARALWATRRRRPCATRPEARLRKPYSLSADGIHTGDQYTCGRGPL